MADMAKVLFFKSVMAMMLEFVPDAQVSIAHTPEDAELFFDGDKRWFMYVVASIFGLKTYTLTASDEGKAPWGGSPPAVGAAGALPLALVPDGGYPVRGAAGNGPFPSTENLLSRARVWVALWLRGSSLPKGERIHRVR